jgi:hypothetical protein
MATMRNAAMRKKTPLYVAIFLIHDTRGQGAGSAGLLGLTAYFELLFIPRRDK